MKTQEEYKKIATEQGMEVFNLLNGVDWDIVEDMLKDNKLVFDFYKDEVNEFIDVDYKDINIALFRDKNNKVDIPMQNVEVWDEEEGKYFPILMFKEV